MMRRCAVLALALIASCVTSPAQDPPIARMEASTVRIIALHSEDSGAEGSGFVIGDGSYVVTNYHVIADAQQIVVIAKSLKLRAVNIVVSSKEKDLAVLQLERPSGRPSVVLGTRSTVHKTESVLAAGFPGAADEQADRWDNFVEVKFTQGIISAFETGGNAESLYQISAALNPGNSGGPLFDLCGRVIGINAQKSLQSVVTVGPDGQAKLERAPKGEGIAWAISADELIRLLSDTTIRVPYEDKAACSALAAAPGVDLGLTGSPGTTVQAGAQATQPLTPHQGQVAGVVILIVGTIAVVILFLIIFAATRKRPSADTSMVIPLSSGPAVASLAAPASLRLRCISGPLAGLDVQLTTERITFGRDARSSQIVFPANDTCVSRRHCVILFDPQRGQAVLEDCGSANGTFLETGERLRPNEGQTIGRNSGFYLGDRSHLFQIS